MSSAVAKAVVAAGVLVAALSGCKTTTGEVDDLARLENLIRIPSVTADIDAVNRAVDFMRSELEDDGLFCAVETTDEGRKILFASNDGSKVPDVIFSAHIDVVAAQTPELFEPKRHDGCIWGRGASDCKEHCVLVARLLRELKGRVSCGCIFGTNEEGGGKSTDEMLVRGYGGKKLVIVLDSEQYAVTTRHKGLQTLVVTATEKPAHTAFMTNEPPSAVLRLMRGFEKIAAEVPSFEDGSWRDVVSLSSITGTRTKAEMRVRVAYATTEGRDRIERKVRAIKDADVKVLRDSPPVWLDEKDPVLVDFLERMRRFWPGRNCSFYHLKSSTDARWMQRLGLPMLILCIDARGGHTETEHMSIKSFYEYDQLIREYLLEKYAQPEGKVQP